MYRQSLVRYNVAAQKMLVLGERDVKRSLDLRACLEVNRKAFLSLSDGSGVVPNRLGLTYPNNPNLNNIPSPPPPTSTSHAAAAGGATSATKVTAAAAAATSPQDWTLIKPAAYYGQRSATSSTPSTTTTTTTTGTTEEDDNDITMGLKVVSVRSKNPSHYGLPLVPATILLVDPVTGIVNATISGTYLTVARTSSGPALAVQTFAPSNAKHLVIFGAGAQAECHIQLIQLAFYIKYGTTIPHITIVNRNVNRAENLQQKILSDKDNTYFCNNNNNPTASTTTTTTTTIIDVIPLDDTEAVTKVLETTADIVATTTNSSTPLWSDNVRLRPGCLITGIGSYTPDMSEVPQGTVNRCHVLVDTPEALHAGDLKHLNIEPSELTDGTTTTTTTTAGHYHRHPITLFGSALTHPQSIISSVLPRKNNDNNTKTTGSSGDVDCIFFKSVGTAIQDVLTSELVVKQARLLGIGQVVDMT